MVVPSLQALQRAAAGLRHLLEGLRECLPQGGLVGDAMVESPSRARTIRLSRESVSLRISRR